MCKNAYIQKLVVQSMKWRHGQENALIISTNFMLLSLTSLYNVESGVAMESIGNFIRKHAVDYDMCVL